jgi:hypothetical protein
MNIRKKPWPADQKTSSPKKAEADGVAGVATFKVSEPEETVFAKEYWTGDSRDGVLENGDGYHYYRMTKSGKILEAYECYELEDGRECANPLPEMLNVHWINDLGFDDFEALDLIKELEFSRIKDIASGVERP